jgi:outer membrane protein OmpA-like peptidoglycan-associated protein
VKLYYSLLIMASVSGLANMPKTMAQALSPEPSMIKSIYFGGGSYYIDPRQAGDLEKFIKSFSNIQNYTITVHSHTDDIGSDEFNQMLSEMRSYMSIQNLLKINVPRDIITIHDFGEYNPIYDNSTMEGRLKNRRVDIILWPIETL